MDAISTIKTMCEQMVRVTFDLPVEVKMPIELTAFIEGFALSTWLGMAEEVDLRLVRERFEIALEGIAGKAPRVIIISHEPGKLAAFLAQKGLDVVAYASTFQEAETLLADVPECDLVVVGSHLGGAHWAHDLVDKLPPKPIIVFSGLPFQPRRWPGRLVRHVLPEDRVVLPPIIALYVSLCQRLEQPIEAMEVTALQGEES